MMMREKTTTPTIIKMMKQSIYAEVVQEVGRCSATIVVEVHVHPVDPPLAVGVSNTELPVSTAAAPNSMVMTPPVPTVTLVTYLPEIVVATARPAVALVAGKVPVSACTRLTAVLALAARLNASLT